MPRQRSRCASTVALPPSPYVPSTDGKTRATRTGSSRWRSATSDDLAVGLEGGVVGEHLDRAVATCGLQRRAGILEPAVLDSGVVQAHRHVTRALAGGHGESSL